MIIISNGNSDEEIDFSNYTRVEIVLCFTFCIIYSIYMSRAFSTFIIIIISFSALNKVFILFFDVTSTW